MRRTSSGPAPVRLFWEAVALAWLIVVVSVSPVLAQDRLDLLAGDKVRIRAPRISHTWVEGILYPTGRESFELILGEFHHDTVAVTLDGVRRFQVAEHKRSNMLLGAVVGTVVGTGLGFLVGTLFDDDPQSGAISGKELSLGIGLGIGFIAGSYIGSRSESDVWRDIPVDRLSQRRPRRSGFYVRVNWPSASTMK